MGAYAYARKFARLCARAFRVRAIAGRSAYCGVIGRAAVAVPAAAGAIADVRHGVEGGATGAVGYVRGWRGTRGDAALRAAVRGDPHRGGGDPCGDRRRAGDTTRVDVRGWSAYRTAAGLLVAGHVRGLCVVRGRAIQRAAAAIAAGRGWASPRAGRFARRFAPRR